jgi:hypothetical protein
MRTYEYVYTQMVLKVAHDRIYIARKNVDEDEYDFSSLRY